MTANHGSRTTALTPVSVRPAAAVPVAFLTLLLATFMLPAAVPDRPSFAYLSAGLVGAGLLLGLLVVADLARAAVARRAGARVDGITVGLLGSRLRTAADVDEPRAAARIARVGMLVSGVGGAVLVALGRFAPQGTLGLAGSVAALVGVFALLLTLSDLLPAPRSGGGRQLASVVHRRTGSRAKADAVVARAGVTTGWTLILLGLAGIYFIGVIGLWAALLGWLALGSSRLEQSRLRTIEKLAGVRVGDVMGPAPTVVPGWRTVDAALAQIAAEGSADRPMFAVAEFDGGLAGVVLARDLGAVPLDDRGLVRVAKLAIPLSAVPTATPDQELTELLPRLARRPAGGGALVLAADVAAANVAGDLTAINPRLVGVVTHREIAKALAVTSLRGAVTGAVTAVPPDPGR